MKSKKVLCLVFLFLGIAAFLSAQSNDVIDGFLEKEKADLGTTMLLLAQSLEEVPASAGPEQAIAWAEGQSWSAVLGSIPPEDPIPLGRFFVALFRSYDIDSGSLMYSLFKSPRYAARTAFHKGFAAGPYYYNRSMSPSEILSALSLAMEVTHE